MSRPADSPWPHIEASSVGKGTGNVPNPTIINVNGEPLFIARSFSKCAVDPTLVMRQFFFAVGKPHRPMDAKLTGEATGHSVENLQIVHAPFLKVRKMCGPSLRRVPLHRSFPIQLFGNTPGKSNL